MKKILYLTKYELRQLKKGAILTAIVLAIFLGALFGVISVQTDMMDNMCAHLDEEYGGLSIYAYNSSFRDVSNYVDGLLIDENSWEGLNIADIIRPDGSVYKVLELIEEDEWGGLYRWLSGATVYLNNQMKDFLNEHQDSIVEGRWIANPFEMCVDLYMYGELGVNVGEVVQKGGYSFTLVGVYDKDLLTANEQDEIDCRHIMSLDEYTPSYRWKLPFATAKQAFEAYRQLQRKGVEVELGWYYEGYYTDITQMRAAFTAVDAVLIIVILVALYSLVSVLFRQRKTQICRLKILGASDRLVAAIYCGTVILLMLAVVLLATGLGVAFNYYFMDLCAEMLQYKFVSHFVAYVPIVAFAVFCLATYLIWLVVNRRTNSNLASEIRYE